jgi:hypothetical protein
VKQRWKVEIQPDIRNEKLAGIAELLPSFKQSYRTNESTLHRD